MTGRTGDRPHVVVVGAGFGGLAAAQALAGAPVTVTVIDRQNHHCFQPLLYQVATAALSPADIAWPIRALLSRQANTEVVMAEVTGIDTARQRVRAGPLEFPYDFLVLATGATHAYFGHPEWADVAPGLKRIEDATLIRARLLRAFERAEIARDARTRRQLLTFVVVGGGPTGVELAGSVADMARISLSRDFRHIDPAASRIVLVEAAPRVLATFPEELSRYTLSALQRLGVEVLLGTRVIQCTPDGIVTDAGTHIEASTILWAAGVAASPAHAWLDAPHDAAGRICVRADLSVPGHDTIFAIGDTAALQVAGRPVPGIAPAAKQMGRYLGRLIRRRLAGKPAGPFRYRHYGDLATIGRKAAVVAIGRWRITGFAAWVVWSATHIYFLIGVRNRIVVALNWVWNYATFQRGARLINECVGGDGGAANPATRG